MSAILLNREYHESNFYRNSTIRDYPLVERELKSMGVSDIYSGFKSIEFSPTKKPHTWRT